jgi:hypothetical protein
MASTALTTFLNDTSINENDLYSPGSNETNSNNSSHVDFSSREAIIGTALIASGLVSVFGFLLWRHRRSHLTTHDNFNAILKRKDAFSLGERVVIPQLNLDRELFDHDHKQIEEFGCRHFLKNEITRVIAEKMENDEPIKKISTSTQVINIFLTKPHTSHLGKHDLSEDISVEYNARNKRCNFFATAMAPLLQSTVIFEMLFGSIQQLSYLQLADPVLPIDRETNNKIIMTQTALNLVFYVGMFFMSPGQAFMTDLGTSLDNAIINLYLKCKNVFSKTPREDSGSEEKSLPNADENLSTSTKIKIRISQAVLGVLIANNLYTEILGDYQRTMAMNQQINSLSDAIIPPWAVYICSMIEYVLNQLNDPMMLFSEIYLGNTLINAYFKSKNKPQETSLTEVVAESRRSSPSVSPLQMKGIFSPSRQASLTERLIEDPAPANSLSL